MAEGTDLGALYVPIEADLRGWTEQLHQAESAADSSANTVATVMAAGFSVPADALNSLILLRTLLYSIGGRAGQIGLVAGRLGFFGRAALAFTRLGPSVAAIAAAVAGFAALAYAVHRFATAEQRRHAAFMVFWNERGGAYQQEIKNLEDFLHSTNRQVALAASRTDAEKQALQITFDQIDAENKLNELRDAAAKPMIEMRTRARQEGDIEAERTAQNELNRIATAHNTIMANTATAEKRARSAAAEADRLHTKDLRHEVETMRLRRDEGEKAAALKEVDIELEKRIRQERKLGGAGEMERIRLLEEWQGLRHREVGQQFGGRGYQEFGQFEAGRFSFAAISRVAELSKRDPKTQEQMLAELKGIRREVAGVVVKAA